MKLAKQMLLLVQHENIPSLGLWREEEEERGWKPRAQIDRTKLRISLCSFSPPKLHSFHGSSSGFLRQNRTEGGFYSCSLSPELEATENRKD